MAIHEIIEVPDPRLKTVSTDVTEFNDELKTLVEDMFETMYAANGIGLAAILIGVPQRVLVIDLQPEDPDAEPEPCDHDHGDGEAHTHPVYMKQPRVFINPVIVDPAEQFATYQEGCLSVPDIFAGGPPRNLHCAVSGRWRESAFRRPHRTDGDLHPA